MKNRRFPTCSRSLIALLCTQLLLTACSASAHQPQPPSGWPEPKPAILPMPLPQPTPYPVVRTVPNFQAPSAAHCARPVQTREVPGWPEATAQHRGEMRDRLAKSAPHDSAMAAGGVAPAAPAAAPSPSVRADTGVAAESMARRPYGPGFASPQPQPQQMPAPASTVTAGMVDDNADFTSYLAFRNRTRVEHRARDIRERYLLEVKDGRGRGIADAEVAVQGASGHAMWARTDAGGRVWLHPNAFDPGRSASYSVAVRKNGLQSGALLTRGQKSAVEVQLEAPAAEPRARLDLVFLIDATGSMADEIGKLKATLHSIAGEMARLPSRPDLCFGLVAYRDKGDAFLLRSHDFTNDLGAFQGVLNGLQAGGGGDYPEAMNEALHETVHNLNWRGEGATRLVVLLADAPPHLDYGGPQYDTDMQAALGKGIKVFSVGASGLDKQGEYIQRQIAQYTGGRFVFLTYADARQPSSGPGRETVHDVKNYSVDTLDRLIVRLVSEELGKLATGG
ncbi:MAG: VWA domain-containing protein [Comamonadaceae bacterium]|nr:MAG: VWA domain-containing protein [Comamonadaceae bacterium]